MSSLNRKSFQCSIKLLKIMDAFIGKCNSDMNIFKKK